MLRRDVFLLRQACLSERAEQATLEAVKKTLTYFFSSALPQLGIIALGLTFIPALAAQSGAGNESKLVSSGGPAPHAQSSLEAPVSNSRGVVSEEELKRVTPLGIFQIGNSSSEKVGGKNELSARLKWSQQLPGAISNLRVSAFGDSVVSIIPDPEIDGGVRFFALARINSSGKVLWQNKLDFAVREMDLSEDGRLLVLTNYGDELLGVNHRGKVLWKAQGSCHPFILSRLQKIVCFHDEDVGSDTAFEIFNFQGKKVFTQKTKEPTLRYAVAQDQKVFVLGAVGGRVSLHQGDGTTLWQQLVAGEVIDVGVSSGLAPKTAVLVRNSDGPLVFVLSAKKKLLFEEKLPSGTYQIALSPQGDQVFYYGEGAAGTVRLTSDEQKSKPAMGQFLGSYWVSGKENQKWKGWLWGMSPASVYYHPFELGKNFLSIGVERRKENQFINQIFVFQHKGKLVARLGLPSEPESYYYLHRLVEGARSKIVAATDDGRLSFFEIKK